MLTKNKAKFIKSLQIKKYRQKEQLFLVEGAKSVLELLNSDYNVLTLIVTNEFFEQFGKIIEENAEDIIVVKDLAQLGTYKSNTSAIAVVAMKQPQAPTVKLPTDRWILALDGISDPGNLGTIIRTADWYGISLIIGSEDCAEFYNPKVIQASMGSFSRVNYKETQLEIILGNYPGEVIGATLEGIPAQKYNFPTTGILVIGSESHGIRENIAALLSQKITISRLGRAESLNAAVATGILLDRILQ